MQTLRTPEDIRKFQVQEPYPDFGTQYSNYLKALDSIKLQQIENDFWEGPYSKSLLRQFEYDCDAYIKHLAKARANWYVSRGTILPWKKIRKLVWIRDGGICDVCMRKLDLEEYECGHIVDRVCGGTDRCENLTVMCGRCNRERKPMHETKEEYYAWRERIRTHLTQRQADSGYAVQNILCSPEVV